MCVCDVSGGYESPMVNFIFSTLGSDKEQQRKRGHNRGHLRSKESPTRGWIVTSLLGPLAPRDDGFVAVPPGVVTVPRFVELVGTTRPEKHAVVAPSQRKFRRPFREALVEGFGIAQSESESVTLGLDGGHVPFTEGLVERAGIAKGHPRRCHPRYIPGTDGLVEGGSFVEHAVHVPEGRSVPRTDGLIKGFCTGEHTLHTLDGGGVPGIEGHIEGFRIREQKGHVRDGGGVPRGDSSQRDTRRSSLIQRLKGQPHARDFRSVPASQRDASIGAGIVFEMDAIADEGPESPVPRSRVGLKLIVVVVVVEPLQAVSDHGTIAVAFLVLLLRNNAGGFFFVFW